MTKHISARWRSESDMAEYCIELESAVSAFYENIAAMVQLPTEQVLSDALFRLAGELSLEALHKRKPPY